MTAFLDISAAYDSVWRQGLIYKLLHLGLRGRMLSWIVAFLSKRFGSVCLEGSRSERKEFKFGLPQGSCLSPVMFNLYLSDMFPENFISDDQSTGLFADDIHVRVSAFHESVILASKHLTNLLAEVAEYGRQWRLRFDTSSEKCGTMTFALFPIRYREYVFFGDRGLTPLSEYKLLGVVFDQRLTFRAHIERVRQKAWAAFHKVRSMTSRYWGASTLLMVRLYRSFVTPCLEYACQVWSAAPMSSLRLLDPVQTAGLRVATGATWSTSQEALEVYCGVWPLQIRREFLCLSSYCFYLCL